MDINTTIEILKPLVNYANLPEVVDGLYSAIKHLENMKHMQFQIGETLVDQSKMHCTSDAAIEKIRTILSKYYMR